MLHRNYDLEFGDTKMPSEILVVLKEEHHYWKSCPCQQCQEERTRQAQMPVSNIRHIPIGAAHVMGFLPRRCEHGSLARQLAKEGV